MVRLPARGDRQGSPRTVACQARRPLRRIAPGRAFNAVIDWHAWAPSCDLRKGNRPDDESHEHGPHRLGHAAQRAAGSGRRLLHARCRRAGASRPRGGGRLPPARGCPGRRGHGGAARACLLLSGRLRPRRGRTGGGHGGRRPCAADLHRGPAGVGERVQRGERDGRARPGGRAARRARPPLRPHVAHGRRGVHLPAVPPRPRRRPRSRQLAARAGHPDVRAGPARAHGPRHRLPQRCAHVALRLGHPVLVRRAERGALGLLPALRPEAGGGERPHPAARQHRHPGRRAGRRRRHDGPAGHRPAAGQPH